MSPAIVLLAAAVIISPMTAADLGGYLERSGQSEFSGELFISCDTPDGSRDAVLEVAQSAGKVAAWTGDDDGDLVTLGDGTMTTGSGDQAVAAFVESTGTTPASSAYTVHESTPGRYLGRDVDFVTLRRDGVDRVRLTVDRDTEVVLGSETFDADGDSYCVRRMLSFVPGPPEVGGVFDSHSVGVETPLADAPPAMLPDTTRGFALLDTYELEDGTLSYYSDGFFSFGVVVTERAFEFAASETVTTVDTGSGRYDRSFVPGSVSVAWSARAGNLALVGDLPPDLLEGVLADLPRPEAPGFFGRMWDRFFG